MVIYSSTESAYRVRRSTYSILTIPPMNPWARTLPTALFSTAFPWASSSGRGHASTLSMRRGTLVRRYSSTDQPEVTKKELEKQLISALLDSHAQNSSGQRRDAPLGLGPALLDTECTAL